MVRMDMTKMSFSVVIHSLYPGAYNRTYIPNLGKSGSQLKSRRQGKSCVIGEVSSEEALLALTIQHHNSPILKLRAPTF